MKVMSCASWLFLIPLALTACGRNSPQVEGMAVTDCAVSAEEVDAEMMKLRNEERDLVKRLRSREATESKLAAIDSLTKRETDFEDRNSRLCRDRDGTLRSASLNHLELLDRASQDVQAGRPVSEHFVKSLDPGAWERQSLAVEQTQQIPTQLQEECGLTFQFSSRGGQKSVEATQRDKINAAVKSALDAKAPETASLSRINESLTRILQTLSDEQIQLLNDAGEDGEGWLVVRQYLASVLASLQDIEKNAATYQKDPHKAPAVWPDEPKR